MTFTQKVTTSSQELRFAAELAIEARESSQPLDPSVRDNAGSPGLKIPLPRRGRNAIDVLQDLNDAAVPQLTGSTKPGFMSWVIGGSQTAGVAADWMTSAWGQNACLYESSPAAALAEEAVSDWLLDILDLPQESTVGFATGATMASFTALTAARLSVFEKAGHDFEQNGFFEAPRLLVYVSEDVHITNLSVLRYLGFGDRQIKKIPATAEGIFDLDALAAAMENDAAEARIVIGQAGHIMSGAFDNFTRLSALCKRHNAWLHVDGAFGLWIRASERLRTLAHDVELADSWSVDGHKWLQVPYDLGFVIVRDGEMHRRAMSMQAGYLPVNGACRNNSDYVPELSRRARGFSAWAVMQNLGRLGIAELVERHCNAAHYLGQRLRRLEGVELINGVCLNQLAVVFEADHVDGAQAVADLLNGSGEYFVRTAEWNGRKVLRFSITSWLTSLEEIESLSTEIEGAWDEIRRRPA